MMTLIFRLGRKEIMKCKKTLLTAIISASLFSTICVSTSQQVKASKSEDIYWQGFWNKHPTRSFKKWRNVVLTSKTKFMVTPNNSMPEEMQLKIYYGEVKPISENRTLPAGTIIKLKEGKNDFWDIKSDKLPEIKYYDWDFDDGNIDEVYQFSFATIDSYSGIQALFAKPRKVKVTHNVRADKLRMMVPAYKIYSAKHKTIKKGTVLTVGAPTNHYNHQIWGKGLKTNSKYIWVINKLNGWYKIIK